METGIPLAEVGCGDGEAADPQQVGEVEMKGAEPGASAEDDEPAVVTLAGTECVAAGLRQGGNEKAQYIYNMRAEEI